MNKSVSELELNRSEGSVKYRQRDAITAAAESELREKNQFYVQQCFAWLKRNAELFLNPTPHKKFYCYYFFWISLKKLANKKLIMLRFSTLFVFLTIISPLNQTHAQSMVYLKDGTVVEKEFQILYRNGNDQIRFKNDQSNISADEIDKIRTREGITLYSFRVDYFNARTGEDLFKYAFLKKIATGERELFEYDGRKFKFAVGVDNQLKVLQKLSIKDSQQTSLENFETVLFINFSSCIDSDLVISTKLSRNPLLRLVNEYNRCFDPEYLPLFEEKKRTVYTNFKFGVGINQSKLDLSIPIVDFFPGLPPNEFDRVNMSGSSSSKIGFNLELQRSLFERDDLFILSKLNYFPHSFDLTTEENSRLTPNKLDITEIFFAAGLYYQLNVNERVSLGTSAGPFVRILGDFDSVISLAGIAVLPSSAKSDTGFGFFIDPSINLKLNQNLSVYISYQLRLTDNDNVFTQNENAYGNDYVNFVGNRLSDNFYDMRFFQIGIKLNSFSEKF